MTAAGAPALLDLFCCAGGAARGYARAGFRPYGVDRDPQPNYPYPFHHGDALDVMATLAAGGRVPFVHPDGTVEHMADTDFAARHGSPPCQGHAALTKGNRQRPGWTDEHVDLIPQTRAYFEASGAPYVIENVQGSPLRRDAVLCGLMFGLRVFRHRYFEVGGWSIPPRSCNGRSDHAGHRVAGWRHGVKYAGDMVAVYGDGGGKGSVADWQAAMGIDWTSERRELSEAIPPAYTEWIGRALLEQVG